MVLEKFNEFYALAEEIPCIINIIDEKKFNVFINGTGILPTLEIQELEIIKSYLSQKYAIRLVELRNTLIKELTSNDISTSNDNQLKSYLNHILEKLDLISHCLYEVSFIKEIKEKNLYPIPLNLLQNEDSNKKIEKVQELYSAALELMREYTSEEKQVHRLLESVFQENYSIYSIISEVEQKIDFIASDREINMKIESLPDDSTIQIHELKTLKSLFKVESNYGDLIKFMIDDKLISKSDNCLIWRGFRSNAKYEIASFQEALYESGMLHKKATDTELANIAMNTFFGLSVTERTMRSKKLGDKITDYSEMLARFSNS
ncbi:hypothetical protein ACVWYG_000582 [Pedobacter sp. UYEF25]